MQPNHLSRNRSAGRSRLVPLALIAFLALAAFAALVPRLLAPPRPSPVPSPSSISAPATDSSPDPSATNAAADSALSIPSSAPQSGPGIDAARKQIDKLVDEQKFAEAAAEAARIRASAARASNDALWAWALIREVQLRTALHGYETSVRFLKEEPWPAAPLQRDMLELFYARSLFTYYQAYSWEINSRERVEAGPSAMLSASLTTAAPSASPSAAAPSASPSAAASSPSGPVDLKLWTRDQILGEAWSALLRVWRDRDRLAASRPGQFPDFWSPGDYPPGIRDTLRDAVVYVMASLLSDASFWTPRQSNELFLLDLPALLSDAPVPPSSAASTLESPAAHPLEKLHALLGEHAGWSLDASRPEAAMEAYFVLVSSLHDAFTQPDDRAAIRVRLTAYLDRSSRRRQAWWAMGQAALAEFTRAEDAPDALIRARALALASVERFPGSPGGLRCLHIAKSIEAPSFSAEMMATDAPDRRSIRLTHRNVRTIYFRAYALDLRAAIRDARDYNLFPRWDEAEKIVDGRAAPAPPLAASFTALLPATPDYRDHATYVDLPPGLLPGLYLVAASAREDFARSANRIEALCAIVSGLVVLNRPSPDGGTEAVVVSGADGRPSRGVKLDLYAYDWQNGHHIVESRLTGDDGRTAFPPPGRDRDRNRRSGPFFLLASRGSDLALDASHRYLYARPAPAETSASLIYTDRSVYRPGQKIYWKVLAYAGRRDLGRLRPAAASSTVSVWLEDINGERVAGATASTNGFGTASGEFVIPPAGRPLGAWRLRSSPNGLAQLRVEEYKRPTFEVKVDDPAQALRLNRAATLSAEARYYFGLPVASGTAVWQVRREPVYPRWWWYWGESGRPGSASQIVAGGRAALRDDGTFEIAFTPSVDERTAATNPGVTYRYTLSVDVTDEGGETRSAERSFRLGFVSVEASISAGEGYFRAGAPAAFTVSRSDLNGTPKPGRGAWHVVRLVQPESTLLPADQPMPGRPGTPFAETAGAKGAGGAAPDAFERCLTPGDRLRPRWEQAPPPEAILRLWKDGLRVASGSVESDVSGRAAIMVPALDNGAYRLIYQTRDDFGATCRESFDFLVAGKTTLAANLPLVLVAERPTVEVGGKARLLLHGGWAGQPMLLETFRGGEIWERRWIEAGAATSATAANAGPVIEIPVTEDLRGGFGARLTALRDHQFMTGEASVFVPWTNKQLALSFATFRDKLTPGGRETWRVTVKTPSGKPAEQGAAELLAYMYDRSLDIFAPHHPPNVLGLYPARTGAAGWATTLGTAVQSFQRDYGWASVPSYPTFRAAHLIQLGSYGIGGPGRRGRFVGGVVGGVVSEAAPSAVMKQGRLEEGEAKYAADAVRSKEMPAPGEEKPAAGAAESGVEMRSNFAETAFWQPHLLTGADGTAAIEFTVPDSVTSWRVFVHGVTRELAGGMLQAEARSVKELMVRPYLPRFFREGDRAELRVVVNNAGEAAMAGQVELEITDPATGENLAAAFGLEAAGAGGEARGAGAVKAGSAPGAAQAAASAGPARASFKVEPGKGATVTFALAAPPRVGTVAFKVTARAGAWSDGELRPLPVLPGRMHLVQSRFVTLKGGGPGATRELRFAELAKNDDPTRINDQIVITVDGQLFYGLLEALPYLVNYPYECTEQTLNRFLSTGILTSLYDRYPAVARMAEALSKRETLWETFDQTDPNRKMALEETPWLVQSRGGKDAGYGMEKVLDPRVAGAQREASLAKLLKAQTSLGAFPWWPGGPPSPYMTLYIVHGFSKALEFGVSVPKEPVVKAMEYLHRHYLDEVVRRLMALDAGWEFVTFLNYTLSNFPDESWRGGMFTDEERAAMLAFSFKHWKRHSPYLKGFLALTLKREKRAKDADLVWASVMDSARTTEDEGTSWAPEDRGWLWYNDTIETHAFALRTLMELDPKDRRSEGLVQWLFLNKKLNHWKSTRATAEVIYSVAYFLKTTGALGARESVTVDACGGAVRTVFTFEPDVYTGKRNQVVIPGGKLGGDGDEGAGGGRADARGVGDAMGDAGGAARRQARGDAPADARGDSRGGVRSEGATNPCAVVRVTKEGKGMAFASATWHFSTERMPEKGEGDLFAVERTWFKREKRGPGAGQAGGDGEIVLIPLTDGVELAVGDEIEVHLSIRARHPAEYVMLRDPRPSGCEPVTLTSGYKWDLGLVRYEEIRDSGTNFFMEKMPQGEYTLKHRMRCAMAGTFKTAPATLQSMYAPEFAAYSSGAKIGVGPQ